MPRHVIDTDQLREAGTTVQQKFTEITTVLQAAAQKVSALVGDYVGPDAAALQDLSATFHQQIVPPMETLNQIGQAMGVHAANVEATIADGAKIFGGSR